MILLLSFTLVTLLQDSPTENWPSFRGSDASGVATSALPVAWNADHAAGAVKGIRWKTAIPELGHSSPIVWGNRLFVATAIRSDGEAPLKVGLYGSGDPAEDDTEQEWAIYGLDRNSGKVLWKSIAQRGIPRSRRHPKASHANTTLATDGKRVIGFFGSEGLVAFDFEGNLLWKKELGMLDSGPHDTPLQWGYASSPVLADDKIVL